MTEPKVFKPGDEAYLISKGFFRQVFKVTVVEVKEYKRGPRVTFKMEDGKVIAWDVSMNCAWGERSKSRNSYTSKTVLETKNKKSDIMYQDYLSRISFDLLQKAYRDDVDLDMKFALACDLKDSLKKLRKMKSDAKNG